MRLTLGTQGICQSMSVQRKQVGCRVEDAGVKHLILETKGTCLPFRCSGSKWGAGFRAQVRA